VTHGELLGALTADGRVVALDPAPAQNANAVVVTRDTADRHGLQAISDLRSIDDQLTFGGPPECPTRPFCILGLDAVYGLRFSEFLALDAGGTMTLDALQASHVDVALMFTTDPMLDAGELVALDDDLHLQPAENVTPLINSTALERFGPGLAEALDEVSRRLTTNDLRELNGAVARGSTPAEAAAGWLAAEGLA
jgi:osmoprotectant transport system substrate-binding protein